VALERPKRSLGQLAARLQASGDAIDARLRALPDSARNRQVLSHVIGIERWGQSRLKTALGAPLLMDEYNSYRPQHDCEWADLKSAFHTTRQETLGLTRQIEAAPPPVDFKAPHNQFGPLSVAGWLRYLEMHANGEIKKMK
jgi:hypothetical protein